MMYRLARYFAAAFMVFVLISAPAKAQQVVFLDFSGTDGNIPYTAGDMTTIMNLMDGHYAAFDFTFTLTAPGVGPFSTITFNAGGAGGLAQHIDFGNTDKNDSAVVNIDGLGIVGMPAINMASAIIGSHELGHLQGLRHGDSYGPIGSGIHSPPGSAAYLPSYPGPVGAPETTDHIMASPASVGQTIGDVTSPSWFSERSAVKLAFNEGGSFVTEIGDAGGTVGTAQPVTLASLLVPNTIVSGANAGAGPAFSVDAVAVEGELDSIPDVDVYSFLGSAGDLMNIEVLSGVSDFKTPFSGGLWDVLDTHVRVLDAGGTVIPYYAGTAINDDEFETFDSILIDLILPADGMYFVEVDNSSFSPADTGNYELFIYRFNGAVPEPGAAAAIFGLMSLMALRQRKRRSSQLTESLG